MFDLRGYSDEELIKLREEINKTRASPLEAMAAILVFCTKTSVDHLLTERRERPRPAEQTKK